MRLSDPLTNHFRLAEAQRSAMAKLGVTTVRELLFHFPFRYDSGGAESSIAGLVAGMDATIVGTIEKLETKKSWKRKIPISEGMLRDTSGKIKMMFFNQPYIAKMWAEGTRVQATGKVAGKDGKLYLANPQLQRVSIGEENLFQEQQTHPSKKSSGRLSAEGAVGFQTFSQQHSPPLEQRLRIAVEHSKLFEELLGDVKNFAIMKKHFKAYAEGFAGAKELRMQLMETKNAAEIEQVIEAFIEKTKV